jgi:hypothetical protein
LPLPCRAVIVPIQKTMPRFSKPKSRSAVRLDGNLSRMPRRSPFIGRDGYDQTGSCGIAGVTKVLRQPPRSSKMLCHRPKSVWISAHAGLDHSGCCGGISGCGRAGLEASQHLRV